MPAAPLLELRGLRLVAGRAGAERTLVEDVGFAIPERGSVGLVGASGSGKSLTAAALIGLLPPGVRRAGGAILWRSAADLAACDEAAWRAYRGRRIGFVFQDPQAALNPVLRIGRQLGEVLELHRPELARAERAAACAQAFAEVGLPEPERIGRRYPHELSGGQRQRALIAIALAGCPDLLIADEPTTALDASVQLQVVELLDRLRRERGLAILWISHDLGLLRARADALVVMEGGRVVESGPTGRLFEQPAHPHTADLVAAAERGGAGRAGAAAASPALLEARGLRVAYPTARDWSGAPRAWREAVRGVDLELRPGETLALVGESGSGKTSLVRALLRLPGPRVAGELLLRPPGGPPCAWLQLREREARPLRRHFGLVFQDPAASLDPRLPVGRSVAEPLEIHRLARGPQLRARVLELLDQVGLEAEHADRLPHQLSGGQNQRVAIARALASRPALLICDEAVSALDLAVQRRILELLRGLQDRLGFALLFITHDLGVARALAHRTAVLEQGEIVEEGPTERLLDAPRAPATRRLVAASRALHSAPATP